jgi:alpha-glucosidase
VIREVTLSTKGGKQCVDFAVARGLQYIEYDAGWYGHEYDDASDATRVSPDPDRIRNIPDHGGLDLPEVIRYARERGIGVILYVNRRALERQLDTILPLYRKWGVAGMKFGFVNVGPQPWSEWLHKAIAKAGEHNLLVDVHDAYRPSGFARTYPNLLTQEGIRGNEHMPDARHNTTLPFTRFIGGAGDYTICYYSQRLKTKRSHQLALAVVNYSPLQFMFWYDKPSAYNGEPEVEFFKHVPTVWDDTKVLSGAIGEHIVVARRSGRDWFVGAITNAEARTVRVPLSFLEAGRRYTATVYAEGVSTRAVDASGVLELALAGSGGAAIRITAAQ